MKKIKTILCILFTIVCLFGCKSTLPLPEVDSGARGELGIDKNINESNIDDYLFRDDSVYFDMRMLKDDANYEAIGGDSYLSGFIKGFEVVPYPYLCEIEGLPEEVGEGYQGRTLYSIVDGEYIANYKESKDIIEGLFPHDKNIFLMCGGGGYAGMTKKLLVALGYDTNKIYNVGGYWYYQGKNNVNIKTTVDGKISYNTSLVKYHDINFDSLNCIRNCDEVKTEENKEEVVETFTKISSVEELNVLRDNKETFLLFVYLPGCTTCAKFSELVKKYTEENQIKTYSVNFNDIKDSNDEELLKVKYAPSLLVYKNGKLESLLDAQSDDDKKCYKDYNVLSEWIKTNIDFDNCNCGACQIIG